MDLQPLALILNGTPSPPSHTERDVPDPLPFALILNAIDQALGAGLGCLKAGQDEGGQDVR
jgi:hypothetical protein